MTVEVLGNEVGQPIKSGLAQRGESNIRRHSEPFGAAFGDRGEVGAAECIVFQQAMPESARHGSDLAALVREEWLATVADAAAMMDLVAAYEGAVTQRA